MGTRLSTLAATLARELGPAAVSETDGGLELPRGLPLVAPDGEDALCDLLARAARERWRVLPIGLGTKLGWAPPLVPPDLVLSTRRLAGVVAYEPGDGTLTARAGSTLAALEQAVAAGGHALTPCVGASERATLGGVLAAGQSGIDRTRHGPPAQHVLGARVALADGTRARSGGRLVKNVTGFDLHRLYCGSHGTLAVLLEATLRLAPLPRALLVASAPATGLDAALEQAERILAADEKGEQVRPWALLVERAPDGRVEVLCVLAGSEALVGWEGARLGATLRDARVERGPAARERIERLRAGEQEAGRWPALRLGVRRSRLRALLAALAPHAGRLRIHPEPARVEAWSRSGSPDDDAALVAAALPWRPVLPEAALALERRLRAALDPRAVLAPRAVRGAP